MSTSDGVVYLQGPTQFTHNTADEDGGAMLAEGTEIQVLQEVNFNFNLAKKGGAMFFKNRASITLSYHDSGPLLITSFNSARELGGVMYYRDNPTNYQCLLISINNIVLDYKFPDCFLQFQPFPFWNTEPALILSRNDSADREDNFMFGGLMDRCNHIQYFQFDHVLSIYPGSRPTTKEISSEPYSLSLCTFSYISSKFMHSQVKVYRGQKFAIPLLAEMQFGNTSTIVTAITSSTARLETYQTSQPLPGYCHSLPYTVYSNKSHEQLVLYPDGPCKDTGTARMVINVITLS